MNNINYHAYTSAILEQVEVHKIQLNAIASLNNELTFLEKTATERSLQVIVEALIGSAKQLNKKRGLAARNDAWSSLQQLIETEPFNHRYKTELRGAIGMRNTIVHDYLLLDWEIIDSVLKQRSYLRVVETIQLICSELCSVLP